MARHIERIGKRTAIVLALLAVLAVCWWAFGPA